MPVFVRLLQHEDRWLRFKAAKAIRDMAGEAKPVLPDLLSAVAQTAEPLKPTQWADPVQLTHGQLAAALFTGPLKEAVHGGERRTVEIMKEIVQYGSTAREAIPGLNDCPN